ncbi:MAG: hypothetical protein ACTHME_09420 [Candidatus Nitrosocosmicus sp.]
MKQRFSIGSKCECNCHGRAGTLGFCGYCTNSHRNMSSGYRPRG